MNHFTAEDIRKSHDAHRARLDAEFWTKVRVDGECLIWTGSVQTRGRYGSGYGVLHRFGRMIYAHRYAWMLWNKHEIPDGMEIMHSCDRPLCIRPSHLSLATHAENMADMSAKGRVNHNTPGNPASLVAYYQEHPEARRRAGTAVAKLDVETVGAIKAALARGYKSVEIARRFDVAGPTISDIKRSVTWSYVQPNFSALDRLGMRVSAA